MDWVHCNTCFCLPNSKIQFNLTSCGHIFCDGCIQKNPEKNCKTCGQHYTGVIPLTNKMKPDVQMYFMDVKDICKNAIKLVQQAQLVAEFQKGHSQRLSLYQKQKLGKFTEMINQAKELERKYREALRENEKLKNFVTSMGYQLTDIIGKPSLSSSSRPTTPKTPVNSLMKSFSNSSSMNNNRVAASPSTQRLNPGMGLSQSSSPMQQSPMNNHNTRCHNPSPTGSISRGLSRTTHDTNRSPMNTPVKKIFSKERSNNNVNSSMVAPGRISMRTPPVNGKIGPIGSSPHLRNPHMRSPTASQNITPRLNTPQARPGQPYYKGSSSKIGQNLNSGRIESSFSNTQNNKTSNNTPREERRPIQLNPPRAVPFPKKVGQA